MTAADWRSQLKVQGKAQGQPYGFPCAFDHEPFILQTESKPVEEVCMMRQIGIVLLLLCGGFVALVSLLLVLQVFLSWFGAE